MDLSVTAAADNAAILLHPKKSKEIEAICAASGMGPTELIAFDGKNNYVKARIRATPKERLLDVLRFLLKEFRPAYQAEITVSRPEGMPIPEWVASYQALDAEVRRVSGALRLVPRNLVFASIGKPTLVFTDVVQGIVGDVSDNALVFTVPDGVTTLTYGDLSTWWTARGEGERLSDRLYRSRGSETEGRVFKFYAEKFAPLDPGERAKYPALLPQVWLHFDPLTLKGRRGEKVLPRQRMDYMMLLSTGPVIIEVDGPEHIRDLDAYSEMMAADRALTLLGYRIFRIAVNELDRPDYEDMLRHLFERLLSEAMTGKVGDA